MNIEINYYNGESFDTLYPKTKIENIIDIGTVTTNNVKIILDKTITLNNELTYMWDFTWGDAAFYFLIALNFITGEGFKGNFCVFGVYTLFQFYEKKQYGLYTLPMYNLNNPPVFLPAVNWGILQNQYNTTFGNLNKPSFRNLSSDSRLTGTVRTVVWGLGYNPNIAYPGTI